TARPPQAGELVGRFGGAGVVEVADEMRRIDGGQAPGGGDLRQGITQVCRAPEVVRQEAPCLIQVAAWANVEMPGPVAARQRRRLVPVILRLVESQQGAPAGLEVEEAVGRIEQGSPDLEGGVSLVSVGPVVLKDRQQRAGVHEQGSEPAGFQRTRAAQTDAFEVRRELRLEQLELGRGTNAGHLGRSAGTGRRLYAFGATCDPDEGSRMSPLGEISVV